MLLIESVKVVEVRGDEAFVCIGRLPITPYESAATLNDIIETECVRGNRFYDMHGNEVCIGMTKEVEKALKLPFDVYYNMANVVNARDRELKQQKDISHRLRYRLETIRGMSFWERLNRVFVGFSTLNTK